MTGVYKCGFAKSQSAYSTAFRELFDSLDRVEAILAAQRYILSNDRLHALDIRLFMTLIRFDEVYVAKSFELHIIQAYFEDATVQFRHDQAAKLHRRLIRLMEEQGSKCGCKRKCRQ